MTARVWTREELDRVHPLPDGWAWGFKDGRPHARRYRGRGVYERGVYVGESGVLRGTLDEAPIGVVEAVILASKGLDSPRAMADALSDLAAAHRGPMAEEAIRRGKPTVAGASSMMALAFDEASEMLRRGRVHP